MINRNGKKYRKVISILLSVIMIISMAPGISFAADSSNGPIVVSMGDSYSSGEGNENFYGWEGNLSDSVTDVDFLAHRSQNSWPGKLKVGGITMKDSKDKNWYFVASSGATTKDMAGRQSKTIKTSLLSEKYTRDIKPQYAILDELKSQGKTVDYVTLTLGGNDVDFRGIVQKLVTGNYKNNISYGSLDKKLNYEKEYYKTTLQNDLETVYRTIAQKTDYNAEILVAGYPGLFEENGKNTFVHVEEAKKVNDTVSYFNDEIEKLIKGVASKNVKVRFVDVEKDFMGKGVSSSNAAINPIWLAPRSQDIDQTQIGSSYSVHPNSAGIEIYRKCMQKAIDQIEESRIPADSKYETVTFGSYEQDNNTSNGKEPIEWYVLEKNSDTAVLMSKNALDAKAYNDEYKNVTWEASTLRSWLNGEFYNGAFSGSEKKGIVKYRSTSDKNPLIGISSGNATEDNVTILNITEAEKYLSGDGSTMSVPTKYAVANGAETCNWWLRTIGIQESFATYMGGDSIVSTGTMVNTKTICVRPVIKVSLTTLDGPGEDNPGAGDDNNDGIAVGSIGTTVKLGEYEQNNNESDGKEAIEWIVLDKKDGKALLISKLGLEIKAFNSGYWFRWWGNSSTRGWLNDEFLNGSFSSAERACILTTSVKNPGTYIGLDSDGKTVINNTGSGIEEMTYVYEYKRENTEDKLFLLSIDEAEKYFKTDSDRKCYMSSYVYAQKYGRSITTPETFGWWLRSQGDDNSYVTAVSADGSINAHNKLDDESICMVRPAMWVKVK